MNTRFLTLLGAFLVSFGITTAGYAQLQFKPSKYVTAPLVGEQFFCYVVNTSDTVNAQVVNVEVYDGATGMVMPPATQNFVPDCELITFLMPHKGCGRAFTADADGSVTGLGYCEFEALGFVTGSLTARRRLQAGNIEIGFDEDLIFTTSDAVPQRGSFQNN